MTRGDAVAIAVLLVLVGALAELVTFTDRVFLPRHPDALDSPWRQDGGRLPGVEDEPLNYVASDKFNLIYPDQRYVRTELGDHGRLAEWNPYILGGVPHAANPLAAVFYPPGWVQLLAAPEDGPLVAAALHLFLAALFVFMLMRVTGLGSFAAAFGGACLAISRRTAPHLPQRHGGPTHLVASGSLGTEIDPFLLAEFWPSSRTPQGLPPKSPPWTPPGPTRASPRASLSYI